MASTDNPLKESVLPWAVFTYGEDMEMQAFRRMDGGGETELRSFLELRGKDVTFCGCSFHRWLVVFNQSRNQYSLFNLLTCHSITLPPLPPVDTSRKVEWVLTAPPDQNSGSFFLVLARWRTVNSILLCKVGLDKCWSCWKSLWLWVDDPNPERLSQSVIGNLVLCNGKIYARVDERDEVLVIELEPVLYAHLLEIDGPSTPLEASCNYLDIMMESNGELFWIFVGIGGIGLKEVVGVEVFMLDFSNKEWVKPKGLGGRALFFNGGFWLYPPSTGMGRELVKSNCVYFFHHTLYSFNLETNGLISYAPTCNDEFRCFVYIDSRRTLQLEPKLESKINAEMKEVRSTPRRKRPNTLRSSILDGLPWDSVQVISRHLPAPRDNLNFRSVNRLLRAALPSTLLTDSLKERQACLSDPWLLTCRKDMAAYTLIDPWHGDRYFMTLAGSGSGSDPSDAAMIYCNGNWCVMVQEYRFIFIWNPFTKEKITLPERPGEWKKIAACAFMNSPHSPDFHLVLLCVCNEFDRNVNVYVDIFQHGEWSSNMASKWMSQLKQPPNFQSELCLFNGDFRLLHSHKGRIWILERQEDKFDEIVLDHPILPILADCSRSYLVNCENELLAVLTGVGEDDVQVFKLYVHEWVAVENLDDDLVLYISHFSSFTRRVTNSGEGNRIYFPRLYDGKLVYYSLGSKRYHCVGGGEAVSTVSSSAGGFQQGTEEQLLSAWIQPTYMGF